MTVARRLIAEPTPWSPGRAAGGVKPPNQHRSLPTVSFSLPSQEVEQVRQLAYARDVSMSQVMREAIALVLAQWAVVPAVVPVPAAAPDEAADVPSRPRRTRPAPPPARPRWSPEDAQTGE
jgi:hypothetical protein